MDMWRLTSVVRREEEAESLDSQDGGQHQRVAAGRRLWRVAREAQGMPMRPPITATSAVSTIAAPPPLAAMIAAWRAGRRMGNSSGAKHSRALLATIIGMAEGDRKAQPKIQAAAVVRIGSCVCCASKG
jgi:hypothetical protein